MSELRENDVVRYEPKDRWCHEGTAVATRRSDGEIVLFDTYWQFSGQRLVKPDTWEVLFNLDDYDSVRDGWRWEKYAPEDRQVVTSQHGLQRQYLVRKGAVESRDQIIANARTRLAEAEEKLRSATWSRDFAQRELDELLAETTPGEEQR